MMKSLFDRVYKKSNLVIGNEMLRLAMEEREKQFTHQHLQTVINLLTSSESVMSQNVASLREQRKQEKLQTAKVKAMDRALRYFAANGNPLPFFKASGQEKAANMFCKSIGLEYPKDDDELWKVPADFTTEAAPEIKE